MYSDKLALLKLDDLREELFHLNNTLNVSDSLTVSKLSELSTSLSEISSSYRAYRENTFFGVSWDVFLPALISTIVTIIVFKWGNHFNNKIQRKRKHEHRAVVKDTIEVWANTNIEMLRRYITSIRKLANNIQSSDELLPQSFEVQHITIDVLSQFTIDRLIDALYQGIEDTNNVKAKMLNDYLGCVSYLCNMQPEVLNRYQEYNTTCNIFMKEWNKKWAAFKLNVSLNYQRMKLLPQSDEKKFYETLTIAITNTNNSCPETDPPFSIFYNLILEIKEYNQTINNITPSIIETSFLGGEVFLLAKNINAIKEYNILFNKIAASIENTVNKFENVIKYYKGQDIIL